MRVKDKLVLGLIHDLSNKPRWAITSSAGRQPGLDRIGADRLCGVRGPIRLRRNHDTRGDVVIVWFYHGEIGRGVRAYGRPVESVHRRDRVEIHAERVINQHGGGINNLRQP